METAALANVRLAIMKHTFVIPSNGMRYAVTNKAPMAEPTRSTLYKFDAIVETLPF